MNASKKSLKVSAIILLSLALATGCSQGNNAGNKTSEKSSNTTAATSFAYTGVGPITDDPSAKLSILSMNAVVSNVDLGATPVVTKVTKNSGVNVDWQLLPFNNYKDAVSPRLASGANLPDIVYGSADPVDKYIQGGVFQPINKLLDEYGVNLNKLYSDERWASVKAMLTAPDGNIYYVPQLQITDKYIPGFMVNTSWLEDLNLKEPTTLDEFTAMLRAFKSYDPNKDGKRVIPFSVEDAIIQRAFGPVFGLEFPFYVDENNKVQYAYYTPRYKEMLTYLNGLYEEGLLDPDFANSNLDKITARFAQNTTGATFNFSFVSSMIYSKAIKDYDPEKPLVAPILPLKGPHGDQFYLSSNPISGVFGITKSSKNPELAFKFLDYAIGPEAQETYIWGDEGVTYTVENGEKKWTDQGKDNEFLQKYGIAPVNMPMIQTAAGVDELLPKWHLDIDKKIQPYAKQPFPFIYALSDEANEENQIMPDIVTFVTENQIKFITGKTSLDKFDKFTKSLKNMNIEAIISLKQAQYDRYMEALNRK